MHSHYFFSVIMRLVEFFHFRCVCRIYFFLNHLTPPSKDKLMPKAPKVQKGFEEIFFWLRVHGISLNLIAFIISI